MPKRHPSPAISVESLLRDHSPHVHSLVERLRTIIHQTVPSATERVQPTWHSLNFHHPESGYFCGVFPHSDYVNVAFEFGVLLPDPESLLEGAGRQVKYLRVRRPSDIRMRAFKELLLAAVALPASRDIKLGLTRSAARPMISERTGPNRR